MTPPFFSRIAAFRLPLLVLTMSVNVSTCLIAAEPSTKASPPATPFAWKSLEIPKALVAVGVWGDMFKWREALHHQGIEYHDAYRAQNAYHRPLVQMVNMPTDVSDYQGYSTIVLVNVDALALGTARLAAIQQFVSQGGGLVVLGGYWAFERGAYAQTPLAEMLPVELKTESGIVHHRAGARLQPVLKSEAKWQADFTTEPRAFFIHALTPRPNAQVLLQAGEQPAVITGEYGAGRVVACLLTVNGAASEQASPFWDWAGWPAVLGQTIEWAGANRPLQSPTGAAAKAKPIDEEEAEKLQLEFQPLSQEHLTRFIAAPNQAAADAIFTLLFPENKQKLELSPALVDALASLAAAEWNETLTKASDSLNPNLNQRRVALELLGATKVPTASKRLLAALDDEDVATGAIAGLRRLGDPAHQAALKRLYERSLSSSDFRNYDLEASSGNAADVKGRIAIASAIALYELGDPNGVERLLSLHKELQLLRRVFYNAAKRRVVETDPTGIAIRAAIWKRAADFHALEQQLIDQAGPVPESQRAAFTAIANQAVQPEDVAWLAAALRKSATSAEWAGLSSAKDGIVRRLAATKAVR